jgi:cell wall-associated NlpC family hydrolase
MTARWTTSIIFLVITIAMTVASCSQSQDNTANKIDGISEPKNSNQANPSLQPNSNSSGTSQSNANQSNANQPNSNSIGASPLSTQTPSGEMLHGLAITPNEQTANHDIVLPITSIDNKSYVKAKDLTNALQFQTKWDASQRILKIGDNDPRFELFVDTHKALREGKELHVTHPFVMQNEEVYIPVTALRDLFQEDMFFDVSEKEVKIHATPGVSVKSENEMGDGKLNGDADFADDPSDPTSEIKVSEVSSIEDALDFADDTAVAQVTDGSEETLKKVNLDGLLREAQKYLGVKYQFGADSFEKTKRFDCSTYTQYVYRKEGVQLPRVAREQANRGNVVSRKSLRKGDLLFFYVPGRFKSNKVVGHVGIYMGGNRMIHAINKPKDGVQITEINKPYWKESFMFGKRVAQ